MPLPSHCASLSTLELAAITLLELKGDWTLAAVVRRWRKDPRVRGPLRRELERRPPVEVAATEAARYLEDASLLPLLLDVPEAAGPMDEAFEEAIDFAIECLGGRDES